MKATLLKEAEKCGFKQLIFIRPLGDLLRQVLLYIN